MDFFTVVESARRRGEIAIGYEIAGKGGARTPRLNPKKSERVTFAAGDRVVVIADSRPIPASGLLPNGLRATRTHTNGVSVLPL